MLRQPQKKINGIRVLFGLIAAAVLGVGLLTDGGAEATTTQSESGQVVNGSPVWSPDGSQIAFASSRDGLGGIWLMDADGSNPRKLLPAGYGDASPTWSPDGRRIAFMRLVGPEPFGYQICIVNSDGRGAQCLEVSGWEPAWSPRGDKIAFISSRKTGLPQDIYLMSPDGSAQKNLTNRPANAPANDQFYRLAWSPDGSKIAMQRFTDSWDLYVMNADGTGVAALANSDSTDEMWPTWSPDGSRIAFSRGGHGPPVPDKLFVMSPGGGAARELPLPGVVLPALSPDWSRNGKIAFAGGPCGNGACDIYSVNPDGSGLRNLTKVYGGDPSGPITYDSFRTALATATAGRKLTAILTVTDEMKAPIDQGTAVCGAVVARRSSGVGGARALRPVAQEFAESRVRCAWRVPRGATGKFVTGTVTLRSGGFHFSWTFSRHVR